MTHSSSAATRCCSSSSRRSIDPVINERAIAARGAASRPARARRARRCSGILDARRSLTIRCRPIWRRSSTRSKPNAPSLAALEAIAERDADRDSRQLRRQPRPRSRGRGGACRVLDGGRHQRVTANAPIASTCSGLFRDLPTWAASIRRLPRRGTAFRASACRPESVGIAGLQTGVYPVESPGGWQLIGRTTTVMFDASRDRPSLLSAGDVVRFVPTGNSMTAGSLHIVKPGLLTTVQDLGRYGHQASGVPVAGPMDTFSHRLANQLVGNAADAATLEITLIGPELIVEADTTMAIAGAHFEVTCDDRPVALGASFAVSRGQRIKFGRIVQGARAYLAVAGGDPDRRRCSAAAPRTWSAAWAASTAARCQSGDRAADCERCAAAASAEVRRTHAADGRPRASSRDARAASRLVSGRRAEVRSPA